MPRPQKHWDRLTGKVAIVTGAGARGGIGNGKAMALLFAAEGARVCAVDRDAELAQETVDEIVAAGGEAFPVIADVVVESECKRIVDETAARYDGIDILVNNVGISSGGGPISGLDMAVWSNVIDVNLKSAVMLCRDVLPHMIARGGGAIVNIGSVAGIRAHGGSLAYGPSKAALVQLAREIAVMHGRDGIRVNTVAPGHIFTPHAMNVLGEEARAARRAAAPLGIEGDAWDVAHAALFLVSDEARFLTGLLLPVDGGVTEIGPLSSHALIERELAAISAQ
ncbi:SDR family oxidoreductase [Novosphingobium sp. G106]|uniref:SDR family NAD(P)-dependent oxidoreductase n=1 Tax=Novosphingobium sp. G106 TaxID=2849500 RepID=UPI001C2D7263|nr:SDR family NAD(P)-dependent oxidoreductase [Novosphingobium sp. G106]MBV1688969.1 SDR family oxidoreductase [Novosphingobium sp. G106]